MSTHNERTVYYVVVCDNIPVEVRSSWPAALEVAKQYTTANRVAEVIPVSAAQTVQDFAHETPTTPGGEQLEMVLELEAASDR